MGRRIATVIGLLLLTIGLALGLWPRTVDSFDVVEVSCGTPFFPASSPDRQLVDPFGDIFGYNPANDDPDFLVRLCWDAMDEETYAGLFLTAAGLVTLLAVFFTRPRSQESRFDGAYLAAPPMSEQERYWRSQGYAPAGEVQGPPPGWVRVEPGPEQPRG